MKPNRYRIKVVRLALLWESILRTHHKACKTCGNYVECEAYNRISAVDFELSKIVG
jgi:hypothetical protein